MLFEIYIKKVFRLHERRVSPTRRDLAIDYLRSRPVGLEISHVNATGRASPPRRAEWKSGYTREKFNRYKFFL